MHHAYDANVMVTPDASQPTHKKSGTEWVELWQPCTLHHYSWWVTEWTGCCRSTHILLPQIINGGAQCSHLPVHDDGEGSLTCYTLCHTTHERTNGAPEEQTDVLPRRVTLPLSVNNGAPNSDETGDVLDNNGAIYHTACNYANGAWH